MSLAAGFTVAAVVAHVAAASTVCPEDAIKTLSTSDVQDLLVEWELDHAFGEEFLQQRVNGYTLQLLSPDTVVPAQYPKAQPFHWTVLWSRLLECKEDDKPQLPVNGDTAVPTNDRRRLGSVGDADAGIHIKRDSAAIALGVDGDILLRRLEARVLAMENDLYFCDGNSINFCNQNGGPSASVGSDGQGNILITGDLKFRQNATSNQTTSSPLLACSFANDITDCANPNSTAKMQYCCDGGGWDIMYQLDLSDDANWDDRSDVPYRVDNSAERDPGSFQRIGYHLQLDDEWVFVSMDAFTDDPTKIGIPVDWIHDHQQVRNVNIVSNSPRLEGIAGSTSGIGIVEMWSNCYRTGSSDSIGSVDHSRHLTDYTPGAYDDDDTMSSVDCYGSFQVHTQAGDTVFAYNGWSYSYLPGTVPYDDVGIGNYNGTGVRRSGWGSDWTYAANAPDYEVKRLSVFVNTYPGTFVPQDIQLVDAIADATGQEPARDCESQCGTNDLCDPTSIFATCMPFAEGKLCDSYTQAEAFASGWRAGGIAVNQAGHIIVADIDNERVMRYGPLSLTDRTAPAGESGWHTLVDGLSNIWGLAVCPNGNVYWAERTDIVVNVLECADDVVPTNGVCYSYASTLSTFYDIGNDGFGGMPYHVACGVDNDVAVSTVSSGGVGGNIHYYNSQTDQWMLLQDADVSAHTVGLSFTPAGDLRVIADIDSDSDSDGVNDYRLFLVECQELELYSPHHGPACAWFGDNRTDYMDADSDNFVSISFHDTDHVHVGDYNWGNVITSADNRVLFGRGTTSNPDALGIMEVVDGELQLLEHSDAVTYFHPWDFSVSPTGDVFMSDYHSKNIFRLVCDDPSALLACEEDGALPFPECNHRYQCEPGYGGPMCNEFLYNCDADFCGSAELCGSEMYECNWWLHERYCADYLSLDEFHDNSFEGAPMGIAVNEKSEIFNVQGTALRKYSPETQTWSDIVTTAGEQLWGLTMCPNGNIYYASRSTQKTILEVACLDSETPTDGVCSTYNSSATEFYILTQSSSDDTVANPYHIACGADNDLAVSTVTYGSILHYDAQTETWTDHVSGVDHCVGLSFSPSADLYALCYVDDDGDNYELVKLPCSSKDDVAFGETPSCSAFADDFESVKTLGGDYGWGAMAITRDGHILINRNDGDDTGTLWEFDIVTEEFRAVDYDTSDTDLYHPWGIAVGPGGTVYISDYDADLIYTIGCGSVEPGSTEAHINKLRTDVDALQDILFSAS